MAMFSSGAGHRADGGDITTVVGVEAEFQGTLNVHGSLRVEGRVEGNILEARTVIISGPKGHVKGDICAEHVVLSGTVVGDVVASVQLELKAGARLVGNIRTPKLTIEDDARFEGSCSMSEAGSPAETAVS